MMNFRLYLMRHGHAENLGAGHDFERNLTDTGRDGVREAANFLGKYQVDKMIVSYVKRTMQTASIVKEEINIPDEEMVEYLYKSGESKVIQMLSSEEDRHNHILLIGHNPTIYNLALELLDNNCDGYDDLISMGMQPSQIVIIDFPELKSWKDLSLDMGKLVEIFRA